MTKPLHVTIWNEFRQEKKEENVRRIYPDGIHRAIADGLQADDLTIRFATLDEPEHGLTQEVIDQTDVLLWWGHCAHDEVKPEIVRRVHRRVLEGMGLIVLHSGHFSTIFQAVTGTSCTLKWREAGERERLWNLAPEHPITQGIGECFEVPHSEMYGERFDLPADARPLFISWFQGGEVFRSGVTFERGYGRVFYFSPGHESYPIYYQPEIRRVLNNAVRWAAPRYQGTLNAPAAAPREPLPEQTPSA